jgi:hypothetical protein
MDRQQASFLPYSRSWTTKFTELWISSSSPSSHGGHTRVHLLRRRGVNEVICLLRRRHHGPVLQRREPEARQSISACGETEVWYDHRVALEALTRVFAMYLKIWCTHKAICGRVHREPYIPAYTKEEHLAHSIQRPRSVRRT